MHALYMLYLNEFESHVSCTHLFKTLACTNYNCISYYFDIFPFQVESKSYFLFDNETLAIYLLYFWMQI